MGRHSFIWLAIALLVAGCRTQGYDRIPATAVDNPDPLMGGAAKPRTNADPAVAANPTKPAETATSPVSSGVPASPTAQRTQPQPDRIGPLTVNPPPKATLEPAASTGISPGTASLTLGVKEPQPDQPDQNIRPAGSFIPAANPEVVQSYRKQLNEKGAIGLRTKQLEAAKWEATAHFPTADQTNQLRRIEAQGTTEADALLAIIEQLEKKK